MQDFRVQHIQKQIQKAHDLRASEMSQTVILLFILEVLFEWFLIFRDDREASRM